MKEFSNKIKEFSNKNRIKEFPPAPRKHSNPP
jgi:hypothetical protein